MSASSLYIEDEVLFNDPSSLTMLSMNATGAMNQPTAIELPQWLIDFQRMRQRAFLKFVEPIIVAILGPMEEETEVGTGAGDEGAKYEIQSPLRTSSSTYDTNNFLGFDSEYTSTSEITTTLDGGDDYGNRRRLDSIMPNYAVDVRAFRETSMTFATLAMLFTIMTCLFLVFLSCFYHNQKTSPLFISPRRHRLPKLVPPPLPVDGTFSWIKVCFFMSDEEIINRVGFDSLIFLRFHRLALRCIVKMSVCSFFIILPINFTGGGHIKASEWKNYVGSLLFTDFLRFTMANVNGGSPRLWVHCIAAYLLSAIVMRELVVEYNAFNNIRHRYLLCKEPHLRTVLVTNIPRHLRSQKKIRNYFKHVYPDAVKNVTMCQNLIYLEGMVTKRNKVLTRIEKELLSLCRTEKRKLVKTSKFVSCIRTPLKLLENNSVAQERLADLYSQLETLNYDIETEQKRRARVMKKMDRMEARVGRKDIDYILATPFIDDESYASRREIGASSTSDGFDSNPSHEDFFQEDFTKKLDNSTGNLKRRPFAKAKQAIKRYSRSVFDVSLLGRPQRQYAGEGSNAVLDSGSGDHIENHTNEVTDKAFIEMKTFTASTIAIQSMHSSKPGAMNVKTAPEPRDVLWNSMYVSKGARRTRGYIGDVIVITIICFYIIPVALISLLVSESALISFSPRLAQLDMASAFFSSAIAMVQPITLTLIQQLLPPLFMQISKAEGFESFSEAQMRAFSRYFMFQVLNVFLVTAIAGSIFDTLAIIIANPETAFEMLGNSLPRMSSFFITLITMKTFLGLGVEMVRTLSIVQTALRYILFPNSTLREKRMVRIGMRAIDDPGWFPFHKILAQDMLVVVISVVFAVVAPIVLLPCALFCLISRLVWTHHHLYVFESVFESGGQFWPKIFRRFVFGLIIAQMTITGQFILKEAKHQGYATMVLILITYAFLRQTRARYDAPSSTLPLEVATIMDITVAQEKEAKLKYEQTEHQNEDGRTPGVTFADASAKKLSTEEIDLMEIHSSHTSEARYEEFGEFDPFADAYVQPSLRANIRARPEQPFPPGQLGREDIFSKDSPRASSIQNDERSIDNTATVKLKSLNERDRNMIDHWWAKQFENSGEQNFFNVLTGEESGTLRLGKKANHPEGVGLV